MGSNRVIRTPWKRYIRITRRFFLPGLLWVAAVASLIILTRLQWNRTNATGVVEHYQVVIAPLFEGKVNTLSVNLLDKVKAGQILAVMDDTLIRGELLIAEAELGRIRATLESEKARWTLEAQTAVRDIQMETRRAAMDEETARLDYLDRFAQQQSDKITQQLLKTEMDRQHNLYTSHVVDQSTYDVARLQYDALSTQIQENEAVLDASRLRKDAAAQRNVAPIESADAALEPFLLPIHEEIRVQEATLQQIKERLAFLVLKSPMDGQVNQIFQHAGDTLLAGAPLLTVANPEGKRVIAYIDPRMMTQIAAGTRAEVFSRRKNGPVVIASITKVGPQMDPLPPQLLISPQYPQWGFPVIIGDLPQNKFMPGEVVDIRFFR